MGRDDPPGAGRDPLHRTPLYAGAVFEYQSGEPARGHGRGERRGSTGHGAEMVEAYLYQSSSLVLVSLGSSRTSLARRQREIGLDRMPLNRVGRIVQVFASGRPYANGHVDRDPMVFRDLREELGIRSLIAQPIEVDGERVGVLVAESTEPERFSEDERHFFQAVSHWVGLMAQRERLLVQ